MKFIFAFLIAFLPLQQTNLETLRDFYPKASISKANADKFQALASKAQGSDAVMNAYRGAAKIIQAKFEKGQGRKALIVSGIKSLEGAVNANPANIELRIIRLSVQENLPKIVGYHSKMAEDKKMILKNYAAQNGSLKQYIREFAAVSKTMTAAEKASLK